MTQTTTDGRRMRRANHMNSALEAAALLITKGNSFTMEEISDMTGVSVRSIYRHWESHRNLEHFAGALVSKRLTEGTSLPNAQQKLLRTPAVVISVLAMAKEIGYKSPAQKFRELDRTLSGQPSLEE